MAKRKSAKKADKVKRIHTVYQQTDQPIDESKLQSGTIVKLLPRNKKAE